jgi:hypothetical protein
VEIVDLASSKALKRCKNHRRDGGGRKLSKVNNGGQFQALEPWKSVGEEGPFYRARKLPVIEFSGRANPRVAPGCTPDRVQRHCSA